MNSSQNLKWVFLGLRAGIYGLPLLLVLMLHVGQSHFFSWATYAQFYLVPALGLISTFFSLYFQQQLFTRPSVLKLTLLLDALLVMGLQYYSNLQISIFLFLFILIILMSALSAGTQFAFLVAGIISLGFNIIALLSPELKAVTYLFQMILYNIAFFTVAWIAGLLADQLTAQGISLRSLQKLNESIVETIPSGLISMDANFKIVSWNPGAEEIFGENISEKVDLFDFLKLEPNSQSELKAGKAKDFIWKSESENKILSARIFPHSGIENYQLALVDDVTELRQLELQLRHQEKLAAVGGLAAGIAHELGNPLAAVSANIQYLEPKVKIEDANDQKLLDNTHKEIARLARLIGEFKDFAKPEKVPVDSIKLNLLLAEVLDQLQRDPSLNKSVHVVRLLNEVPGIGGSRDKLVQVFMNLLLNGYQAVSEAAEPEIKVICVIRAGFVEVRISDNGVGMSAETKKRLFEPFYTTKGRKGTGLGLAIAHKILDAHQVKVTVNSEMGSGTEFILQFPVQQIDLNH